MPRGTGVIEVVTLFKQGCSGGAISFMLFLGYSLSLCTLQGATDSSSPRSSPLPTCASPPLPRCGDPVSELLVVFRGSVAVLHSLGQMAAILQPGDSWGGMEAVSKVRKGALQSFAP